MSKLIFYTKGINDTSKTLLVILELLLIIPGIWTFKQLSNRPFMSSTSKMFLMLLGIGAISSGITGAIKNAKEYSSYIEVYEDRILGKGICEKELLEFNILNRDIKNISIQDAVIFIETETSKYKIIAESKIARNIFDYYIMNIRENK